MACMVYHQFTVLTPRRDQLQEHLAGHGIGTAIHYPEPLHHQPALDQFACPDEELPVSVAAAREVLCLPMFPELTDRSESRVLCGAGFFRNPLMNKSPDQVPPFVY